MTKNEFRTLFEDALELAAVNAEKKLGRKVPRNFKIVFFGGGHSGALLDPNSALDILYLGEDLFYRIVDISVKEVDKVSTRVYVRVSQHKPSEFSQTWNDPPGSGPFKQLIAENIKCEGN